MKKPIRILATVLLFLACSSKSTTDVSSASASGTGGAAGASSSTGGMGGAGGAGGSGGYDGGPIEPIDSGATCVPNGGITQMCDPDAGLLCPPICCDSVGCICFACRLHSDGVRRCVASATDAGVCP